MEHFKFIDKRDIIQKEYDEREKKNKNTTSFNINESNNLIMKKTEFKKVKITDQMPIKTNIIPKNVVMPKKRIFNLKDPKLMEQGKLFKSQLTQEKVIFIKDTKRERVERRMERRKS